MKARVLSILSLFISSLTLGQGTVKGTVLNDFDSSAIDQTYIVAKSQHGEVIAQTSTDTEGNFILRHLPINDTFSVEIFSLNPDTIIIENIYLKDTTPLIINAYLTQAVTLAQITIYYEPVSDDIDVIARRPPVHHGCVFPRVELEFDPDNNVTRVIIDYKEDIQAKLDWYKFIYYEDW